MLAILNSLIPHNLPIFQLNLLILVSKFMVHRALSGGTYLLLGLLSPLIYNTYAMKSVQTCGLVFPRKRSELIMAQNHFMLTLTNSSTHLIQPF